MLLKPKDLELFFKLHRALMFFVNQRQKVIPDKVSSPAEFGSLPPGTRLKVRDAFLQHNDLLSAFVEENPSRLTGGELEIAQSWQHLVQGKFYVLRQLKKHMVFISSDRPAVAYGVLALSQPFEELVGPYLPVLTEAVLLPFKDVIVYDGLMTSYNISFGPGIRRSLNASFKGAKDRYGMITSLPVSIEPLPPEAPTPKSVAKPRVIEAKDQALQNVIGLIDQFCDMHLNKEYAAVCRRLAEKLGRKRPSPLLYGSPNLWASGIVRAVGGVNFLHDKSQKPYMRATDIDYCFGVSTSSGGAKAAEIRRMVRMDDEWTVPKSMGGNSLNWMVQVNGLPADIRQAPRRFQEIAFNKGLIPYIPADRDGQE